MNKKISTIWEEIANSIRRVAIEVLGESKGKELYDKET